MEWINYSEKKPENLGSYLWRMESNVVAGLIVIARAEFRNRWAGYGEVDSPEFDYWNGYSLELPPKLQWREDNDQVPDISFENLPEVKPCPFCSNSPSIKSSSGFMRPRPYELNTFWLSCCRWISRVDFKSPSDAVRYWNGKFQ